jgi:hypothetical protein
VATWVVPNLLMTRTWSGADDSQLAALLSTTNAASHNKTRYRSLHVFIIVSFFVSLSVSDLTTRSTHQLWLLSCATWQDYTLLLI